MFMRKAICEKIDEETGEKIFALTPACVYLNGYPQTKPFDELLKYALKGRGDLIHGEKRKNKPLELFWIKLRMKGGIESKHKNGEWTPELIEQREGASAPLRFYMSPTDKNATIIKACYDVTRKEADAALLHADNNDYIPDIAEMPF